MAAAAIACHRRDIVTEDHTRQSPLTEGIIMSLKALALNATLKSSKSAEPSSTERVLALILQELGDHDVQSEMIWLADHDIKAGVTSDEGEGDGWPGIREKILLPIFFCLAHRYGSDSLRACANERWSAWMHFWRKRTRKGVWFPTARLPRWQSSGMRMGLITFLRNFSRL